MTKKTVIEVLPLTSLRFFLATWIVLFHLYAVVPSVLEALAHRDLPWLNTLFCGYVAVSVFFVLSGFVLALNYPLDASWDLLRWKKFAAARISRIYPVYLLGLVIVAPIMLSGVIGWHTLVRQMGSLLVNVLMLQSWIRSGAFTWNGPGWSISDEAFFYVCFPLIGRFFFRFSLLKTTGILLCLWAVSLVLPISAMIAHLPGFANIKATGLAESSFASFAKFNPIVNLPSFLAGICACKCFLLLRRKGSLVGRGYLLYVPSFTLLFTATSFGKHIPFPLINGGLLLPCSVGIILGLALGDGYLCKMLSNKVLVFLGKASYAEYLLHFPIRAAFSALHILSSPIEYVFYLLTVLAVSALVFHYFEDPLHYQLRNVLVGGRSLSNGKPSPGSASREGAGTSPMAAG